MIIFAAMKKIASIIFGLFFVFPINAQDEDGHEESHTPTRLYSSGNKKPVQKTESWIASGILGTVKNVELDTALNGFFITNPAEKNTIALEHLGNIGSPGRSKIYFDRQKKSDFFFINPYEIYYISPEEVRYYDTKLPYTNLSYFSGGLTGRPEHYLNGVFAVNVNTRFNIGMYGDWINDYGAYPSQSTKNYNAGFFGSYMGKHHNVMANISFNGYESYENGGLVNIEQITNPKLTQNLEPQNMNVYFDNNVWSKLANWNTYLNYTYHIGIEKSVQVAEDSVSTTFIPVTSLIYKFRSENSYKKYYERNVSTTKSFYQANNLNDSLYVNKLNTIDSVRFSQMKHILGISLNQEYNTLTNFGLTGYAIADIRNYTFLDGRNPQKPDADSLLGFLIHPEYRKETKYKIGTGATLAKYLGENLTYDFSGEYYFLDEKKASASFLLEANIRSKFSLGAQKVNVDAQAEYRREWPDFFEEYYFSNHIKWDNDFSRKNTLSVKGVLTFPSFTFYPSLGLAFSAGFKDVGNYVYWDSTAMPVQHDGNIRIVEFTVKEQIKFLWVLHWDNEVTYQKSSDEQVIPLPELSWYSNLYFRFNKLFDVLTIQLGADMRYNTKYYAPRYLPATGVFYMQNEYEVGDYPYINAYINCHLKQARFYIQYNHLNQGFSNNEYLVLPGYALSPSYIKIGISAYFSN